MTRFTRSFLLAASIALVLTACPSRGTHPAASPAPSPTVRHGGAVTVAYPSEPATLDPFVPAGAAPPTRDIVRLLVPGLYRIAADGRREPWLLAGEPGVAPGSPFSVTLSLRDDAVWSDGVPITVKDLIFTWRNGLAPSRSPMSREGYDSIASIVAETPKRARIEFRSAFPSWPSLFSYVLPSHAMTARRAFAALARGFPVSGGPFVLSAWHRGLDMVLIRNQHAWGVVPSLDRIRIVFVPDSIAAMELFRQHTVDVLGPYRAPDWIRHASMLPGATVSTASGSAWTGVLLNTHSAPLSDLRVRRAFADAFDRPRMARGLAQSDGRLLNQAGGTPALTGPFSGYGDLVRARAQLQTAGWSGSGVRRKQGRRLTFTLAVADADTLTQVLARAIQYQAAAAGFNVEALPLDSAELWSTWVRSPRFQAVILSWRDVELRARFGVRGPAAQKRLAELVPVIPLVADVLTLTSSSEVSGVRAGAQSDGVLWNAAEWTRA